MIIGNVNYLARTVTPSLRRNGQVLTRRNADGSDSGGTGVKVDSCEVSIADARIEGATCESNGFELVDKPNDTTRDFYDHAAVLNGYYDECAEIVREITGASFVAAFDHNIRSALGKGAQRRIKGGQEVQGPAYMTHGDYTLTSAPQRLLDLTKPSSTNDTLRELLGDEPLLTKDTAEAVLAGETRYAIINLWRSIGETPVVTDALALCDGRSVVPEDLVVFEIHYADRIGENYFALPSEDHRWLTYPAMNRNEALLIKQWDSAGTLAQSSGEHGDGSKNAPCTFSFHTAFTAPKLDPKAPRRESIEVRCVVLYD